MWRLEWDQHTEFYKVGKQVVGPVRSEDGPWYELYWMAWAAREKSNAPLRAFDVKHGIK